MEIEIKNQHLILHPEKVAFWEEQKALLVADLHIGKVTHFRKAGFPVPREKMLEDLQRLDSLLSEFQPASVYFLGDLFHSDYNREVKILQEFIDAYPSVNYTLISGNHDLPGFIRAVENKISVLDGLQIGDLLLVHDVEAQSSTSFQIGGHIHPAVRLKNRAKHYLKLPCFYLSENSLILPAFGSFTGHHIVRPKKNEQVFVVAGKEVVEMKNELIKPK
jgi:DNA ligase-associated metallophosphoesterase